jgi:hypothetical protein
MGLIRGIVGGLIGGAAGVAIWVLVGYLSHYEVGWIAWAVGFLVGFGVRYSAHLGGQDASFGKGILASVIAFGAIIAAKFLVFSLLVGGDKSAEIRELASQIRVDDEAMIAGLADDIVTEATARGQTIAWPQGVTLDSASKKSDYPPKIWQQAVARWNQLGPKGQNDQKVQRRMLASQLTSLAKRPEFGDFFSPLDLLWLGLAVVTAFKVGVGSYGSDD